MQAFCLLVGLSSKNPLLHVGSPHAAESSLPQGETCVNGTSMESRWNHGGISKLLILVELTTRLDAFCVRQFRVALVHSPFWYFAFLYFACRTYVHTSHRACSIRRL